jgi:hypothetical protein
LAGVEEACFYVQHEGLLRNAYGWTDTMDGKDINESKSHRKEVKAIAQKIV